MLRFRPMIFGALRSRNSLDRHQRNANFYHYDEPTQPFDNLPFKVRSRYAASFAFAFFFGIGLWAPFVIVWYSMAKRTMNIFPICLCVASGNVALRRTKLGQD